MEKQKFIEEIAGYVRKYATDYEIMVHSAIIAQAILESNWGESKLAMLYHNYFGLKCGSKWTGKSVNLKTCEEYVAGEKTVIKDDFRVYGNMDEGVKGYFEFLQLPRYQNLRGITDPLKYLETIKADAYATSSTYVQDNYALVVQYDLTRYDDQPSEVTEVENRRQKVVDLAESWIGKNEADGSYKEIIDIYNSLPTEQLPRKTRMEYGWAWCACTWSALAIRLGYTDIMPIEISCRLLIDRAKEMGIWREDDAYIPQIGDAILYDWNDSGTGDNTGNPDHVGVVSYVNEESGYMVITEGNYEDAVKKRIVTINGKYIRGYITPEYGSQAVSSPVQTGGKEISEVAQEVIAGQWGNGEARKKAIEAAGYDYAEVQAEVNRILNGTEEPEQPEQSDRVEASCYARYRDAYLTGTYVTTADLHCRDDAGTNKKSLGVIPKGTEVRNSGYYNMASGKKWLYIWTVVGSTTYVGYCSETYLKKKVR